LTNFGYKIDRIDKTVDIFVDCDCGKRNLVRLSYLKFDSLIKEINSNKGD